MRCSLLLALLMFAMPAHANVQTDTEFMVDVHMGASETLSRLDALADQAIETLEPGIAELGGRIIDRPALKDVLQGDINARLLALVRAHWIAEYETTFSEEEIARLAHFYRGAAWQDAVSEFLETGNVPSDHAVLLRGPFALVIEHWTDLQAGFPELMAQVTSELEDLYALERFPEIFKLEDVIAFESEARRQDVIRSIEEFLQK